MAHADESDPYRWLEDAHSTQTKAWIETQDQHAQAYFNAPAREVIKTQVRPLFQRDAVSVPTGQADRLFFRMKRADLPKPQYWVKTTTDEHLVLDPATFEGGGSVGEFVPSPDGQWIAYTLHPHNADAALIHVRHVDPNHEEIQEVIAGADEAGIAWSSDSRGFYYFKLPDTGTPESRVAQAQIRYHALHTAPTHDPSVYPPTGDASVYLTPLASHDGRTLCLSMDHGWTNNSLLCRDLTKATTNFAPVFASTSATGSVVEWGGDYYVLSHEHAPHGQIVRASVSDPLHSQVIVAERNDANLDSIQVVGGRLIVVALKEAQSLVEVHALTGALEWEMPLPPGSVDSVAGLEDRPDLYIAYESFFVPSQVYHVSLKTHQLSPWHASGAQAIDAKLFEIRRVVYPSKDGTSVPMWIVQSRGQKNPQPFLLYGYGGFSTPMVPRFNEIQVAWLQHYGGLAIPQLRGGNELGEAWHRAGMLDQKQHTFDDFAAAAEFLVRKHYTRQEWLAVQGASNGGLTVAALLSQHPERIRAAVCKNPLTDMVRYPLSGEGKAWIPEYGDPSNPVDAQWLSELSPYHHLNPTAQYPSVLFLSASEDDRVDPMHARKMAARLQTMDHAPVIFRRLMEAGHGGAGRTDAEVEEAADRLYFLQKELGLQAH